MVCVLSGNSLGCSGSWPVPESDMQPRLSSTWPLISFAASGYVVSAVLSICTSSSAFVSTIYCRSALFLLLDGHVQFTSNISLSESDYIFVSSDF